MDTNKAARIIGLAVILIGILVAIAWIADIALLKSPLERGSMKFSTSISFVFSGVILYFAARMLIGKAGLAYIALPASSLVVSLFMVALLAALLSGIPIGIENLFVQETDERLTVSRPSITTMVSFILMILVSALTFSNPRKAAKQFTWVGLIIAAIGGIAVVGHTVNAPALYYSIENVTTPVAFHTAILLLALGLGIVLLGRQEPQLERIDSISIKPKITSLTFLFSIIPIVFLGIAFSEATLGDLSANQVRDSVIIFGSITAATVLLFAYQISRSIVQPILDLKNVSRLIAKGHSDKRANENPRDEIGELAYSFNIMLDSLKERDEKDMKKEEFAAMISHELKTPLTPIEGYLDLLQRGRLGELTEQQKQVVKIMYDNSQRLLRLIQDILDVRKIEVGRLKLNMAEVSSKYLVEQCINSFSPTTKNKNIEMVDGVPDVTVKCDGGRIIQVLNNIVSNAVKFVPEGGRIEINAKSYNGSVVFSVKDNGAGIPQDKQKDLFKKFYQVDTSLSRKSGGSGLGLAICKGIVEAHGGEIWVESEENMGTTVHFSLPRGMET